MQLAMAHGVVYVGQFVPGTNYLRCGDHGEGDNACGKITGIGVRKADNVLAVQRRRLRQQRVCSAEAELDICRQGAGVRGSQCASDHAFSALPITVEGDTLFFTITLDGVLVKFSFQLIVGPFPGHMVSA